jgi:hypothetical protein
MGILTDLFGKSRASGRRPMRAAIGDLESFEPRRLLSAGLRAAEIQTFATLHADVAAGVIVPTAHAPVTALNDSTAKPIGGPDVVSDSFSASDVGASLRSMVAADDDGGIPPVIGTVSW